MFGRTIKKLKEVLSAGGARNPADVIRDNQTVFTSALMKPIEAARKGNFKAMEAEDAVFKRLHYERALMQYLSANKIDLSKAGRGYAESWPELCCTGGPKSYVYRRIRLGECVKPVVAKTQIRTVYCGRFASV